MDNNKPYKQKKWKNSKGNEKSRIGQQTYTVISCGWRIGTSVAAGLSDSSEILRCKR